MNLRAATISAVCAILALAGCDKNPLGTTESRGHPPILSGVTLTPNAVAIDTVTPVNGVYKLSAVLRAKVADSDGQSDIRAVEGDIVDPSGNHLFIVPLHDDGILPDSTLGDRVYSALVSLSVTRAMIGRYYPYVTAMDGSGLQSTAVAPSILVFRKNSPPELGALSAPDTLVIPSGGTVVLFMTLAVSDPDGLADIKEVYFTSPDGSNPTYRYDLKDDGSETQPSSGDAVAGDGTYSILLSLTDSPTIRGRYRFVFQARDALGDTSASLLHYITVL
jgi:hypothetical protein